MNVQLSNPHPPLPRVSFPALPPPAPYTSLPRRVAHPPRVQVVKELKRTGYSPRIAILVCYSALGRPHSLSASRGAGA